MAINLPPTAFAKFNEAIKLFERTATLVYPEKRDRCDNCISNTMGGRSSNFYKTGGPIPFERGSVCPLCNGQGFKLIDAHESVQLRIYHRKRDWIDVGIQVDVPNNTVQTITYLKHLPQINKAKEVLINKNIQGHEVLRYRKTGESITNGLQHNRYIITFWKRS